MTPRTRSHALLSIVAVIAMMVWFALTAAWLINRPEVLRHALTIATMGSGWTVSVGRFEWRPLSSSLTLERIDAVHADQGKRLHAGRVHLTYKPLGLLRGRLVVDALSVDRASLGFPSAPAPSAQRPRQRLNLARIILLNNLELQDVVVRTLSIAFGQGLAVQAPELHAELHPSFIGDTHLSLRLAQPLLTKGDRIIASATNVAFSTTTELARWEKEFPYLNAAHGNVRVIGIRAAEIDADAFTASAEFSDGILRLSNFSATIGGSELTGKLVADMHREAFEFSIAIPKPIVLPFLGRSMETIDTAGELMAAVQLSGTGFSATESSGTGHASISHRFRASPAAPATVTTDLSWAKGVILLNKTSVQAGADTLAAGGEIDIPRKRFAFTAAGKRFPLEHVFDKFRNPHLRKIFGETDVAAQLSGWGRTFTAKVIGTTFGGGWKPITAERVETELTATFNDLRLLGTIFTNGRQTGHADLHIRYGAKIDATTRAKQIDLDAAIDGHPLETSLAAYGLSGIGNGRIQLSGPHTAFRGETRASIDHGQLHALPFDRAEARFTITRSQLRFSDFALQFPHVPTPPLSGTIVGDIGEGTFRLHGSPLPGLSLDATYGIAAERWLIKEIAWADPERPENRLVARGDIAGSRGLNLHLDGRIDLETVTLLAPILREGSGPIDLDLTARGSTSNPQLGGRLAFHDNTMALRGARLAFEHVGGALRFEGDRIHVEDVRAMIDDGDVAVRGYLDRHGLSLSAANLQFTGQAMRYRSDDATFSLEMDTALTLSGSFPSPLLRGELTILDGKYTKDFTLLDALAGGRTKRTPIKKEVLPTFNPRLDLRVHNAGDFAIRNNVGDIWLNVNIDVRGTRRQPAIAGAIEATEGKIHYLGLDFDVSKGFIEFLEKSSAPYLEVTAQKEVGASNVTLVLHGATDNLALDLSATSPAGALEKRDVISLLLFGITDQERNAATQQAGSLLSTSAVMQSVSGIVGSPIQKIAHLDVFRLEASTPGTAGNVSRVYFGKQVSDRLTVNFATDINTSSAVQTVIGEYQITDNLLLTGQRSSDNNYKLGGTLRFRLR